MLKSKHLLTVYVSDDKYSDDYSTRWKMFCAVPTKAEARKAALRANAKGYRWIKISETRFYKGKD